MQAAIEVWGHLALFTRPEYRMERVSYDVITPSAAQGLLKAIYWHPGVEYQIDYIQVLSPIRRMSIKTNEVTRMTSVNQVKAAMMNPERVKTFCFNTAMPKTHTPRVSTYLKDVRYIIHFTTMLNPDTANANMNEGKMDDILSKRLQKGSCFAQPYLGTRECEAHFKLYEPGWGHIDDRVPDELLGEVKLSPMFHSFVYPNSGKHAAFDPEWENGLPSIFFRPRMFNGFIETRIDDPDWLVPNQAPAKADSNKEDAHAD